MSKNYLKIKSRHPSHQFLRKAIKTNRKVLARFGSTTPTKRKYHYVINPIEGIENSSDKLLMKGKFEQAGIKHCRWFAYENGIVDPDGNKVQIEKFPIIAKHRFGSRGRGNYKLDNNDQLNEFLTRRKVDLNKFIFEQYTTFSREYRLHVYEDCFYTCRKLRRNETPQRDRWKFNNDTCVWILEKNPSFNKPDTWDEIIIDCIRAKNAIGLTIGACDVRVSKEGDWKIVEINSAPALGNVGKERYFKQINEIVCAV
jgi:glutathione synthase/RimK-type ligase-like ATP-grasp enzyme